MRNLTALQHAGIGGGQASDLADALGWLAEHMGWVVDAAGVRIYGWEPETATATLLAEYFGPHARTVVRMPDEGISYVESDPLFLEALLAGQPWVNHAGDPSLPISARDCVQACGARSILYVPLHIEFQVIGYAALWEDRHRRDFTPEERTTCQIIARSAAIAIENVRLLDRLDQELQRRRQAEEALQKVSQGLEQQVRARTDELNGINAELVREIDERKQSEADLLQRNRELLAVQAAAAATSASLDLHFVLDTVTWEMATLLDVEACAILEWHQGSDVLSMVAAYGLADWADEERGSTAVTNQDLTNYPLRRQVLVERYAQQVMIGQSDIDPAELAYMRAAGIKTLLLLPMVYQDRVVGLVEVRDSQRERSFADQQISLAQFLAIQTASAIENARLYDRAQREIAERMRAEERIKASLEEKEMLLKEIHHRVKNNLQVISSMLNLQARSVQDQSTLEVIRESQNRIRSMALIHERLYRSLDLAKVDFGVYIRDLANQLIRSYEARSGHIDLRVDAEEVFLDIDTAIPCGLVINELISNSLKYAFPSGGEGEIYVTIRSDEDDQVTMIIGDNGIGLPPDLDLVKTGSLGLKLVNVLVNQLDGKVKLNDNGGAEFEITFAASQG